MARLHGTGQVRGNDVADRVQRPRPGAVAPRAQPSTATSRSVLDSPQNEACRSPSSWLDRYWECSARTRHTVFRLSRPLLVRDHAIAEGRRAGRDPPAVWLWQSARADGGPPDTTIRGCATERPAAGPGRAD